MSLEKTKYAFRRKDYLKIKNWFQVTNKNYIPIQSRNDINASIKIDKNQKTHQAHVRFLIKTIILQQQYANRNLKCLTNVAKLVLLSSIFKRSQGCYANTGKEMSVDCSFDVKQFILTLKEEIVFFVYLDVAAVDYQFWLQVQMIDRNGNYSKLGTSRYSLAITKQQKKKIVFYIISSSIQNTNQLSQLQSPVKKQKNKSKSKSKSQIAKKYIQNTTEAIGHFQVEANYEHIKQISKFLNPFQIIDHTTKVPPTTLNLKKDKQQIIIQIPANVIVHELIIKIQNPENIKKQLLANNPFTLSHKQLVMAEILQYRVMIDVNNSWKFLNPSKSEIVLDLVMEKEHQLYLSSKRISGITRQYYQSDLTVLIVLVICKVEFTLNGIIQQKRTKQFIVAWVPLPLDLSQKDNKIDIPMVQGIPFPGTSLQCLNIHCTLTATITHPLFAKFKPKHQQKKIFANQLPLSSKLMEDSTKYKMISTRKRLTDTNTAEELNQKAYQLDRQIEFTKQIFYQQEMDWLKFRYVEIIGRAQLGEIHKKHECVMEMEETVGKTIKMQIQLTSLIPETDSSQYYLPRKMRGVLHCLRQKICFDCKITQNIVKFQIPIRITPSKTIFNLKTHIQSVQQFYSIFNSHLIIVLYEEDSQVIYSKGIVEMSEVFGACQSDKMVFVHLVNWSELGNRRFGSLILTVSCNLQKNKQNSVVVEEQFQIGNAIRKLPMQERLKIRIGNYKGDSQSKNKTISMLKQNKHGEFITNIIQNQLICDGEISYQIGVDSYLLLTFNNQDKSQNNQFTFHLSSQYAQLVNDELEFRKIVQSLHVQRQNYKKLDFIYSDKTTTSYYQTTLRFNQQIGILVKLNVQNYDDRSGRLNKIQLLVKRNTIETKKYRLKCKYKQRLFWNVISQYDIIDNSLQHNGELRVSVNQEVLQLYRDIKVLNSSVRYDAKTNQFVLQKYSIQTNELLLQVYPKDMNTKVIVFYRLTLLPGRTIGLQTGSSYRTTFILPYSLKQPVFTIRSNNKELNILNPLKINSEQKQDITIVCTEPFKNRNLLIRCYDLGQNKIYDYLFKVQSQISHEVYKIMLPLQKDVGFSIQCHNPYACSCKFKLVSSSSVLAIAQHQLNLQAYASKIILGSLTSDHLQVKIAYLFLIDFRENVVQTIQVSLLSENKEEEKQQY